RTPGYFSTNRLAMASVSGSAKAHISRSPASAPLVGAPGSPLASQAASRPPAPAAPVQNRRLRVPVLAVLPRFMGCSSCRPHGRGAGGRPRPPGPPRSREVARRPRLRQRCSGAHRPQADQVPLALGDALQQRRRGATVGGPIGGPAGAVGVVEGAPRLAAPVHLRAVGQRLREQDGVAGAARDRLAPGAAVPRLSQGGRIVALVAAPGPPRATAPPAP